MSSRINYTMKKETKRFVSKLELHIDNATSNLKYAVDRFDILIISISSGGLVFSMGYVKDLLPKDAHTDLLLLKLSWILFGSAIIINLLSQVTSYYANKYDIKITRNIIRIERKKPIIGDQSSYECKERIFSFMTNLFNFFSLCFLIIAIVLLIIFVSVSL